MTRVLLPLLLLSCTGSPDPSPLDTDVDTDNPDETDDSEVVDPNAWVWDVPIGFPEPYVPADNPMSAEKVTLGRHLFWDRRLSGNGTQSCGDCHEPELGFADGLAVSRGSTGEHTLRGSMSLTNVAFYAHYTWANPVLLDLEDQAAGPMFGEIPVELGITGHEEEVRSRFAFDPDYAAMFAAAFPEAPDAIGFDQMQKAIASFLRTMISGRSGFDRFTYDRDEDALSESAVRGMSLFYTERLECFHCHGGFLFSRAQRTAESAFVEPAFDNTGLYNIGGNGSYPPGNQGLYEFTGLDSDRGRFRPPSLRNISRTAPYMHDGSMETLDEVIDFYGAGGRNVADGPYAGDGRDNPNKSAFVVGFILTEQERADLIAFLDGLTDEAFLANPAFSNPWPDAE